MHFPPYNYALTKQTSARLQVCHVFLINEEFQSTKTLPFHQHHKRPTTPVLPPLPFFTSIPSSPVSTFSLYTFIPSPIYPFPFYLSCPLPLLTSRLHTSLHTHPFPSLLHLPSPIHQSSFVTLSSCLFFCSQFWTHPHRAPSL